MKKDVKSLIIGILAAILLSYLIFQSRVRTNIRFFWTNEYYYLVYGVLILAIIIIIARRFVKLDKLVSFLKYPFFFIALPLALFPIIRCYFKIPYLFCRVCPRKCPWGELRPMIIPFLMVQNLDCRFWCFKLCPLGSLQDHQSRVSKKKIKLPSWLKEIRYFFLAFTILIILRIYFSLTDPRNTFLFDSSYDPVLLTVIIAIVIFGLAFFIPRFWCNYFCPIGTLGDILLKLQCWFRKK